MDAGGEMNQQPSAAALPLLSLNDGFLKALPLKPVFSLAVSLRRHCAAGRRG